MITKTFTVIFLVTSLLTSINISAKESQDQAYCGCQLVDKACVTKCLDTHPIQTEAYWPHDWSSLPLDERFSFASQEHVEWIQMRQSINDETINGEVVSDLMIKDAFTTALNGIPLQIINLVEKKIAGFVIMSGTGVRAEGESTYINGEAIRGYLTYDSKLVRDKANRFNDTKFQEDNSGFRSRETIAIEANDNPITGIQSTIIHEMGHILGMHMKKHPAPWDPPAQSRTQPNARTIEHHWTLPRTGWIVQGANKQFEPLRLELIQKKLFQKDIPRFYKAFEKTSFSSLYSVSNYWEDFAEAFFDYVWVIILKRPRYFEVLKEGIVIKKIDSCMLTNRCPVYKKFFDDIFAEQIEYK